MRTFRSLLVVAAALFAACSDATEPVTDPVQLGSGPHEPPPPPESVTLTAIDSTTYDVLVAITYPVACDAKPCPQYHVIATRGVDTLIDTKVSDASVELNVLRLAAQSTLRVAVMTAKRGEESDPTVASITIGAGTISPPPPPPPDTTPTDTVIPPPPPPPPSGSVAELPRLSVNTAMPIMDGATVHYVPAGGSFQAALDVAERGDIIELQSGASYVGNFVFRNRLAGQGWVILRTRGVTPTPGLRVTPQSALGFARVLSSNSMPAFDVVGGGASYLRVIGVEFGSTIATTLTYNIVRLGLGTETSVLALPNNIILDRVHIAGHDALNNQRCVAMNGATIAVIDSRLSGCHYAGADAQAIGGWNGPGPYLIENNFLEGSGENIMFGGADPRISGLRPSDITIVRNHLYKPLAWQSLGKWTVKNSFELKNAQRVLFRGNVIENNWLHGQTGFAVVLKTQNQSGTCTWCQTRDVTIEYNKIMNSPGGFNMHANQAQSSTTPGGIAMTNLVIRHNLLENVARLSMLGDRRLFQLLPGSYSTYMTNVQISNNTGITEDVIMMMDGGPPMNQGIYIQNNLWTRGRYGIFGSGKGEGNNAIAYYLPGATITGNVIVGAPASIYPTGNSYPTSWPTSTTAGVDVTELNRQIAGVR